MKALAFVPVAGLDWIAHFHRVVQVVLAPTMVCVSNLNVIARKDGKDQFAVKKFALMIVLDMVDAWTEFVCVMMHILAKTVQFMHAQMNALIMDSAPAVSAVATADGLESTVHFELVKRTALAMVDATMELACVIMDSLVQIVQLKLVLATAHITESASTANVCVSLDGMAFCASPKDALMIAGVMAHATTELATAIRDSLATIAHDDTVPTTAQATENATRANVSVTVVTSRLTVPHCVAREIAAEVDIAQMALASANLVTRELIVLSPSA